MTPVLKEFIKENKQLIEDNKWFEFFSNYCNLRNNRKIIETDFAELMYMFQAVDISIDESVLQRIIYNKTIDTIKLICKTQPYINLITYRRLWQEIHCSLGYSFEELKQIFNEAAKVFDFEPGEDDKSIVRITKSS